MPIVELKPVELIYYGDRKPHAFWLNIEVVDSFKDGIAHWIAAGKQFHVTETLRTIEAQARLRKQKPTLANRPGWSLHGHGRAVDFDVKSIGGAEFLKEFYEHMQRFGWYTIFNFPGGPVKFAKRESWHIQKTDPVGTRAKDYLNAWAKEHGGGSALFDLKYRKL